MMGLNIIVVMLQAGQLTGVIVTYDHMETGPLLLEFQIDGTLLFYTPLTEYESLEFIEMLYGI
ncbi:hypothetical protein VQ056_26490 [Paenibacillus sp. JTLBN-2024]